MMTATKKILETTKNVDLILQLVDARSVLRSSNQDLIKQINKPTVTIAIKKDLADLRKCVDQKILYVSTKDLLDRKKIIDFLYLQFESKIKQLRAKGLIKPIFNVMVVGLPNIGKSSLINFLSQKNAVEVQNKPGLTRSQKLIKINENFYLYDTPGIFVKNIGYLEDGIVLALLKTVSKNVLELDLINQFAFDFYCKKYPKEFLQYFKLDSLNLNYGQFKNHLAAKLGFFTTEHKIDDHRLQDYLFKVFSDSKVCKVN